MKNLLLWVAAVSFFGMIGSTARYLYELGRRNDSFSFRKWLVATFIGATIAVITGLVCKHFMLSDELLYAFVGIAAISSKEMIQIVPDLFMKAVKKRCDGGM